MPTIYIIGEINDEAYKEFSKELSELEEADETDVDVEITSEGGTAFSAIAFFDRMRNSDIIFSTKAIGHVESAAVLIWMAGDKRYMTDNTWIMVHEDSGTLKSAYTHQFEDTAAKWRRHEKHWCSMLAEVSKVSLEKWLELHRKETYLNKIECKELGILDEI